MKWADPKSMWGLPCCCALICGTFLLVATTSNSQVLNAQAQGLVVKADDATLCALIGKMQIIALRYYYDPEDADPRMLHPYAVGYSKPGNLLLFGRQVGGYSRSAEEGRGKIPGWRNFRGNGIKMGVVKALESTFEPIRPTAAESRAIVRYTCKFESELGK